jgi:hypothetical protein
VQDFSAVWLRRSLSIKLEQHYQWQAAAEVARLEVAVLNHHLLG